ncbi:MAG: hypothetical protein AABY16_01390 [Nanoarchaeota archaeon]
MQKIQTAATLAAAEQRRSRFGGIVIIAILLLSTAGFALSGVGFGSNGSNDGQDDGPVYNGQYWVYNLAGQQYSFTNSASEVDFSAVSNLQKNLADFSGRQVYIDSDNTAALQEILINLGRHVQRISEACYGECDRDLPEKTCESGPMIVVRTSEQQSVREEQNCVFIDGDLRTVDVFLYKILGLNYPYP